MTEKVAVSIQWRIQKFLKEKAGAKAMCQPIVHYRKLIYWTTLVTSFKRENVTYWKRNSEANRGRWSPPVESAIYFQRLGFSGRNADKIPDFFRTFPATVTSDFGNFEDAKPFSVFKLSSKQTSADRRKWWVFWRTTVWRHRCVRSHCWCALFCDRREQCLPPSRWSRLTQMWMETRSPSDHRSGLAAQTLSTTSQNTTTLPSLNEVHRFCDPAMWHLGTHCHLLC